MSIESLMSPHRRWMQLALREAQRAYDAGDVPVGAVVVRGEHILGRGHNQVERLSDPTAHAEILAITAACATTGQKWLEDATLYVTLEPCAMCAGAAVLSRVERIVFGAMDEKAGAVSTLYNIPQDTRLNHYVDVIAGVEEESCSSILTTFFRKRRK
ncbi:MAG: tRNA-specific adenosine deaminase [Bacteroidetes bacterium CG12_big_fil_rev_8_21_14_0_65_60_17]|nr:MAG: tRNA-specific adenosine deaminase [Bacteroidetes bacterium CG12_big_fil_rev_8_21_14_0_65_60_17]